MSWDYQDMLSTAIAEQRKAQQAMDLEMFVKGSIDEVSLLFDTPEVMQDFIKWALKSDVLEHFNTVPHDRMWREDTEHEEWFDVRFEFLKLPHADWRIEAMCVLGGIAPLHSAALKERGQGCVVHASWKCGDKHAYDIVKRELGDSLGTMVPAVPFNAEYRNSYGLFSYWGGSGIYFKPRVNLRDR